MPFVCPWRCRRSIDAADCNQHSAWEACPCPYPYRSQYRHNGDRYASVYSCSCSSVMTYQPDSVNSSNAKPTYYSERTEVRESTELPRVHAYKANFPFDAMGATRVSTAEDPDQSEKTRIHSLYSGPLLDVPPPLGVYLRGLGVLWHALNAYKDLLLDVAQSLFLLFLQHPALGVFCTVLGVFVLTPLGVFLGFSLVSAVSVAVTALIVEGLLVAGGVLALFFAVPTGFVVGLGAASAAAAAWMALNWLVKMLRGREILEEVLPARYRAGPPSQTSPSTTTTQVQ
ncbi:uncharacterized protein LOC129598351 [Paramacrobiotus metropolitanus]|uniref:uncharacterized protein LOC129598351 n=1 Tax=Paramacrobiotus metropolitanus TaxID=2943436 RepID=UPI002445B7FB|nr:uncharacterized protein LOC129598351 [Paramacrobiotus metropolitanus]XP_055352187.1 uncharacterized protein LOC129598351 [Paramacrobiotus metropolitanus]XP_055352188.1 uncharacterized protein LOC129598351 [Paramacrobiotus metropolitanus]